MGKKKVHALAQSCAIVFAAFARPPMIAMVWFIIDMTPGLVLRTQGVSQTRDDWVIVWESTYEFMLANAPIAIVRFPVT
jgi:hypothetical protein